MRKLITTLLVVFLCTISFAQSESVHYDINPKYPRYATETDKQLLNDYFSKQRSNPKPAAPISAVAEFQPMSGVLIAYPLGVPVSLVRELSKITNVKVLVNSGNDSLQAKSYFNSSQVNMNNVQFWVVKHDSYWVRDYGPWFIIDGHDSVNVVDFVYNRPSRPNDDAAMEFIVDYLHANRYEMPMVHTGGNYMTDGYGTAASTMLVEQENPNETAASLQQLANDYLGIENYMFLPDPLGEYIAHIDCWGKFLAVDKVLIGKVSESDPRYSNYEAVAQTFANSYSPWGNKYKVYRVYSNPNSGNFNSTPYTNSLIVNDHVFVPITGNSHDNEAISVYQVAMPGYTIVPIMQSNFTPWLNTDALHCRTHEIADLGMLYIKHRPTEYFFVNMDGQPYDDQEYTINATIKSLNGSNLISDSVRIFYRINGGNWESKPLTNTGGDNYQFDLMTLNISEISYIEYYIFAKDESGRVEKHPYVGAAAPHTAGFVSTIGIENRENLEVDIYPNPAISILRLSAAKNSNIDKVQIFDLQGRLVLDFNNLSSNYITLDIDDLSAGFYLMKITDKFNNCTQKKFMKK